MCQEFHFQPFFLVYWKKWLKPIFLYLWAYTKMIIHLSAIESGGYSPHYLAAISITIYLLLGEYLLIILSTSVSCTCILYFDPRFWLFFFFSLSWFLSFSWYLFLSWFSTKGQAEFSCQDCKLWKQSWYHCLSLLPTRPHFHNLIKPERITMIQH